MSSLYKKAFAGYQEDALPENLPLIEQKVVRDVRDIEVNQPEIIS